MTAAAAVDDNLVCSELASFSRPVIRKTRALCVVSISLHSICSASRSAKAFRSASLASVKSACDRLRDEAGELSRQVEASKLLNEAAQGREAALHVELEGLVSLRQQLQCVSEERDVLMAAVAQAEAAVSTLHQRQGVLQVCIHASRVIPD